MQFDATVYSLNSLQSAAYRCIGDVTCNITAREQSYICSLIPKTSNVDMQVIKCRYIDTVNDEALRERLGLQTEPIRNLLLSLAFGALAQKNK